MENFCGHIYTINMIYFAKKKKKSPARSEPGQDVFAKKERLKRDSNCSESQNGFIAAKVILCSSHQMLTE